MWSDLMMHKHIFFFILATKSGSAAPAAAENCSQQLVLQHQNSKPLSTPPGQHQNQCENQKQQQKLNCENQCQHFNPNHLKSKSSKHAFFILFLCLAMPRFPLWQLHSFCAFFQRLLSGFRLPWPPSCCQNEPTPFVVSDERAVKPVITCKIRWGSWASAKRPCSWAWSEDSWYLSRETWFGSSAPGSCRASLCWHYPSCIVHW